MTARAAAISASETRPSDLATCPMTSYVARNIRTPISSASAVVVGPRRGVTLMS